MKYLDETWVRAVIHEQLHPLEIYITISTFTSVCPYVLSSCPSSGLLCILSWPTTLQIPAIVAQNFTDKNCWKCVSKCKK